MIAALVALLAITLMAPSTAHASRNVYATYAGAVSSVQPFGVAADGSMVPREPMAAGTTPQGIALTPDGTRLFVANAGGTTISAYSVDTTTGDLTARPAISDLAGPAALAITPDGSLMFAANPSGSVTAFTLDALGNATPSPTGGATLATTSPDGVAVSPNGSLLFVAEGVANKLAVFAIGSGGLLTSITTTDTGAAPVGVAVSPDGSHVYVANSGADTVSDDGNVSAFTVASDGALTTVQGSPFTAGDGAAGLAMAPDGTRMLVANPADGSATPFLVNGTTGALSVQAATTGLSGATGVVISPDSKRAYVTGARTWGFTFAANGALTALGASYVLPATAAGASISPNIAPFATFDPAPNPATTPTRFFGATAHDDDGSIAKWHWSFGDGSSSDEMSPTHVFVQPGNYTVTLTVTDNEGCSASPTYTGQTVSCTGGPAASQSHTIQVPPPPDNTPTPQSCQHVGNDGFCGTSDLTAPTTTVLGFNDGASITTIDAPDTIAGSIANDPSGIKSVLLRFTKAAGFVTKKNRARKRVCHKVKGRRKKKCARKWVTTKIKTKTPLCQSATATKRFLVSYVCSNAPWISIGGTDQFRWDIPVALGIGTYTVDVYATDGAGNADSLEAGRNHMSFKIVKTPSNSDGGVGTTTPPTTAPAPITDTGSPFG
jgi:DNA-binding beta-propeller fold protein YncE/PKD repeat protein